MSNWKIFKVRCARKPSLWILCATSQYLGKQPLRTVLGSDSFRKTRTSRDALQHLQSILIQAFLLHSFLPILPSQNRTHLKCIVYLFARSIKRSSREVKRIHEEWYAHKGDFVVPRTPLIFMGNVAFSHMHTRNTLDTFLIRSFEVHVKFSLITPSNSRQIFRESFSEMSVFQFEGHASRLGAYA